MSVYNLSSNFISNNNAVIAIGDMAAKVATQNFDYRYATLLFFNSSLIGVQLFLRIFNFNLIINRGMFNSQLIRTAKQYVIFGSDIFALKQLLDKLREQEMKNTGKFIVVCQSEEKLNCDEKQIMIFFWEYKIVNVVFIKYGGFRPLGYTYFPISEGDCNNMKPMKLDVLNDSQYSKTRYGKIFEMKISKLDSCPLFVSTFLQRPYMSIFNGVPVGADGDLLRIIAYALNTTVKMMTPQRGDGWGFRDKNGTWIGSLADVYDGMANVSMTSAALTLTRFSDFQISRSYYTVQVVWVTHPATLQNEALRLLHPFREDARIALIVSYLFVILCAFLVKTDQRLYICFNTQRKSLSKSLVFYSWMVCMGQSLIKLPSKSFFLQMTILWVYYCFIIRTAYQVYLISSLKGTFYEGQIETIEEAIQSNYPFGGGAALQDYYIDYPDVYNNWINIDTDKIVPTALNISKGEKFVLAMNWITAKLVIKKYKVDLHILPQRIASSPTTLFLKKYSPFADSINVILSRLLASGFPEMLHKKYTSVNSAGNTGKNEALTLKHFTACYAVLIIGWLLSIIFFSLEVYFGKIYKHPLF